MIYGGFKIPYILRTSFRSHGSDAVKHFVSLSPRYWVSSEKDSCECLFSLVISLNLCHILGQVLLGIWSSCSHGGCSLTWVGKGARWLHCRGEMDQERHVCVRERIKQVEKRRKSETTEEQVSTPRGLSQILRKVYSCLFLRCADFWPNWACV